MYEIYEIACGFGIYYHTSEVFSLVKTCKTRKQAENWVRKHS